MKHSDWRPPPLPATAIAGLGIAALGIAALAGCTAPASPSAPSSPSSPGGTPAPSESATAATSPSPLDLAAYPTFCSDIQALISVGDEFGGILTLFYEPRDVELINQSGADLARLYATESALYASLAEGPDPRVARDAEAILAVLPAADGAIADLAVGATDWDSFNRDLNALYASPVFADTSSPAHAASDELWDIAYATCEALDG